MVYDTESITPHDVFEVLDFSRRDCSSIKDLVVSNFGIKSSEKVLKGILDFLCNTKLVERCYDCHANDHGCRYYEDRPVFLYRKQKWTL